jgi:multiple sugar transport system substrate-binding protein
LPACQRAPTSYRAGRNKGFSGPTNQKAAQVGAQYIVSDTFAKAIQTGDAKSAIEEGAKLMERIYGRG